jgi:hypothetical protein
MKAEFSWVKARAECAVVEVLKALQRGAQQDVSERNELLDTTAQVRFKIEMNSDSFSVLRIGNRVSASVKFTPTKTGIRAMNGTKLVLEGDLTLNDEGQCRLRVNGDEHEVEFWQFRRRALEDLFFGW